MSTLKPIYRIKAHIECIDYYNDRMSFEYEDIEFIIDSDDNDIIKYQAEIEAHNSFDENHREFKCLDFEIVEEITTQPMLKYLEKTLSGLLVTFSPEIIKYKLIELEGK